MGRNIDELMRKFKANLYLARKADEGCPSKWKDEGDKTLRPGPRWSAACTRRSTTDASEPTHAPASEAGFLHPRWLLSGSAT